MESFSRRQFFMGSAGLLLGLSAGCGSGSSPAESLVGNLLLNESYKSRVVAALPDGTGRKQVLDKYTLLSVSPDGQVLEMVQLKDDGSNLATVAHKLFYRDGAKSVTLASVQGSGNVGVWSPDGQYFLVRTAQSGSPVLVLISRAGQLVRTLVTRDSPSLTFRFGWLSNTEVVWSDTVGTYKLSREGGVSTKLSELAYHTPSPDGRYVLRGAPEGTVATSVERLDVQTGATETVLTGVNGIDQFGWSRDGKFILLRGSQFTEPQPGRAAFRVDATTRVVEKFPLINASQVSNVVWSPDSQSFAFSIVSHQGIDAPSPTSLEVRGAVGSFTLPEGGSPVAWL